MPRNCRAAHCLSDINDLLTTASSQRRNEEIRTDAIMLRGSLLENIEFRRSHEWRVELCLRNMEMSNPVSERLEPAALLAMEGI